MASPYYDQISNPEVYRNAIIGRLVWGCDQVNLLSMNRLMYVWAG